MEPPIRRRLSLKIMSPADSQNLVWRLVKRAFAGLLVVAFTFGVLLWAKADPAQEVDPDDIHVLADDSDVDDALQVVALGDSYMSGEGTNRFLSGTDHGHWGNACRRSDLSYPVLLANSLRKDPVAGTNYSDVHLSFAACSGAVAGNIGTAFTDAQVKPKPQYRNIPNQIEVLNDHKDADVVLLSVGGNDAGFSKAVLTCTGKYEERTCEERAERWLAGVTTPIDEPDPPVPSLALKLRDVMHQIRAVAPTSRYYVTTYPDPVSGETCPEMGLSDSEVRFISQRYLDALNENVRYAARAEGFEVIDLSGAWRDRGLCAAGELSSRAVNSWNWQFPDWWLDKNPAYFLNNSVHPTVVGHRLFLQMVEPQVRAGLARRAPNIEPEDPAVRCELEVDAGGDPSQGPPTTPHPSGDQCANPPPYPASPNYKDDYAAMGTWCSHSSLFALWKCELPGPGEPTPAPPRSTLPPDNFPPKPPDLTGKCTDQTPYYYVYKSRSSGDLEVHDAEPGTAMCYRAYSGRWIHSEVNSQGSAMVAVGRDVSGMAGRRQVLYQSARDGQWILRVEWPRPEAPPSDLDFFDTWLETTRAGHETLIVVRKVQALPKPLEYTTGLVVLLGVSLAVGELLSRILAAVRAQRSTVT